MKPNPMLVNVWRRSLAELVEITVDSRKEFQALRFQLYHTRKILEAMGDPMWETIRNFSITTEISKDASGAQKFKLVIGPTNEKIEKLLEKQGFGESIPDELADLDPTKE